VKPRDWTEAAAILLLLACVAYFGAHLAAWWLQEVLWPL
jgi:hypothetical protein